MSISKLFMIFSALLHTYVCTYVLKCKDRAQSPLTKSQNYRFIIGHENSLCKVFQAMIDVCFGKEPITTDDNSAGDTLCGLCVRKRVREKL